MVIIDQNGCTFVDSGGDSGDAPFTEQICFDLPPGRTYTVDGDGGAIGGATTVVTAQCCGDSETLTLGHGTEFNILAELIIDPNGQCSIRNNSGLPCVG